jgi:hypothetical protein
MSKLTDNEGKAVYSNLAAGMYLVAQLNAESSEYIIAPYLAAVPTPNETRIGEWNYNVISYPKTEPVKRETEVSNEKIIISGGKLWYHHIRDTYTYIPDDQKPVSITLLVFADGYEIIREAVTAAQNWQWNIELDKYALDGHEIEYTIDEAVFYDYRKWIVGYDLINEYSPGDDTIEIPDDPPPLGPPDDGPNGPNPPVTPDSPPPSDISKTGDESNIQLWILMLAAGAVGLAVVIWVMSSKRKLNIQIA